jgi:hypothetical protein
MQWQHTALNQANRSSSLDSEIWNKTSSYMDQLVKEVTEIQLHLNNINNEKKIELWLASCLCGVLDHACLRVGFSKFLYYLLYSAFNREGNRERSVKPEQHLSRIAGVTADSGMSQQRW